MNDVQELLDLLAKRKLSVAILTSLNDGPLRYTTLQHVVSRIKDEPVHSRTLTDTLNYLCGEHLVEHHYQGADYGLTIGGRELVGLLTEIRRWSRQHRGIGGGTPAR
ncbi:winged helix-turn-helix transcriptional regulator [Micromonospora aurantiaca (nom. illeg.)]|uniref:winged helix-turn-helix transcriptional regulator n=1 Tax=Micromonospora aurantiaca (nom. illeg.) TaxID=47850 RepID=UPI0033D0729B